MAPATEPMACATRAEAGSEVTTVQVFCWELDQMEKPRPPAMMTSMRMVEMMKLRSRSLTDISCPATMRH